MSKKDKRIKELSDQLISYRSVLYTFTNLVENSLGVHREDYRKKLQGHVDQNRKFLAGETE